MHVFVAGSFFCLVSLCFSLISTNVSLEFGLLSGRKLLVFGMALSTTVLIAVTIKSAYLSRSLVDRCPEKSVDPSASSSVDSNTSRSVQSNLYLMWLVDEFLSGGRGGYQLRFRTKACVNTIFVHKLKQEGIEIALLVSHWLIFLTNQQTKVLAPNYNPK